MADPAKIIDDLKQAADGLKQAAADLKKASGGKPIGQSLLDAAKNFLDPAKANDIAGRRTVSDLYGFDPKPDRETRRTATPVFQKDDDSGKSDFKRAQHEMIRALVQRESPKETREKTSTMPQWQRNAQARSLKFGRGVTKFLGKTKLGRMMPPKMRASIGGGAGRMASVITGGGRIGAAGAGAAEGAAAGGEAAAVGGEAAAGAAGGPIGLFIAAIAIAITSVIGFAHAVVAAADQQREAMFKYAEVSAGMALVKGEAEYKDTLRDMQRGERLAPSARMLSNADQKLKDNSTELLVLVDSLKNGVLSFLESGLAEMLGPLNEMAKGVNKWLKANGFLKGDDEQDFLALDQFLDRVKKEADATMKRGDQWHQAARADRR